MKSTGMLCCWLKILYYIVLISYHVCDVVFDWRNYFELTANRPFSGFGELLFWLSCTFGLVTSLGMIVVYRYYIHQVSRGMHLPWLLWLQVTHFVQPQFQRFRVVVFDSGTVLQGCHSKLHIISLLQIPIGHLARTDLLFCGLCAL